jgi:aspartate kinase
VVTQGFIGSTPDNASVTLGREGSDYSAALLASMLQASSVTIWKDVPGLLNADPRLFPDAVLIPQISFHEVIEMAYFGAQVIHPKTIKPLQNSGIPLLVRSFMNPAGEGTTISSLPGDVRYPPLIIFKQNQILLQFTTRDFSFITEDNLTFIYSVFHKLRIRVNMIQNAAISFVACIDYTNERVDALTAALEAQYKVLHNEGLTLLTIRHYTPDILARLTRDIALHRGKADATLVQAFLDGGWSRENLVDVIVTIGDKTVTNYLHAVTQVPVDFPAAPDLHLAIAAE